MLHNADAVVRQRKQLALVLLLVQDHNLLTQLVARGFLSRFKFITQSGEHSFNTLLVGRLGHDRHDISDLEIPIKGLAISHQFLKPVHFFVLIQQKGRNYHIQEHRACQMIFHFQFLGQR